MYIGIDLGTSNSAIASYADGELRLLKTVDKGTDVLPSVIYIDRRGHKFYGHRAYEHLFKNPENAVDGFKRQMGTSWKKEFAKSGEVMNAEECSADILRQLVAQADLAHGGQPVTGVVITTPAAFNQMQIEATKQAAKMAGIEHVALLQEPVAAAMAAVSNSKNKDGLFLIYDIGGGTFDLALVQSTNGNVSIIAHEGINALGGRDFDRIIINSIVRPWLLENFALPADFQKQPKYEKMIRIMRMAAETAKIELSVKDEATIYLPDDDLRITDEEGDDIYMEIPVNRQRYNELISDKLQETIELSHKILKSNGYQPDDIDRLILIGGPSKTPGLRELIPQSLGLSSDISTDPMTAVALGAAIFCEGVNWEDEKLSRKKTRERAESAGGVKIQYDYQNRTAQDRARLRIRAADNVYKQGHEIQIDSTEGWSSGRVPLTSDVSLELPLDNNGENRFRAMAFSSDGKLIDDATTEISITRMLAGADALKLTHNLAVMIMQGEQGDEKNSLHIFAEKGIDIPSNGTAQTYRAAKELSNPDDSMNIKFYEQPNKVNPMPGEPNLFIGSVIIKRSALKDDIMKGDSLSILWAVDESGVISIQIKIDKTGETAGGKFYSPETGHLSYEGRDGERLVADMLNSAGHEVDDAEKLSDTAPIDLRKLRNSLKEQSASAQYTGDGEERRAICEKIRDIRQKIAEYRNDPKNLKNSIELELRSTIERFNEDCRDNADEETRTRFDQLAQQAKGDILGEHCNYEDGKRCIEEMNRIIARELFSNPRYIVAFFHHISQQRHTAIDTIAHDDLVRQGESAIENRNIDELREILAQLFSNQIGGSDGGNVSAADFSDIMLR